MAKKNEPQLTDSDTKHMDKPAAGALATNAPAGGGALVEGRDAKLSISRLALFQGTPEEVEMYGEGFKAGDFIDTLENRSLGQVVQIVPVAGWTNWAKFVRGQKAPVYSTRNRAEVPPEDLAWNDKTPPAAVECVNMIVTVVGEPYPYLFMFKRTGLKAYEKSIEPMEARYGHSVYKLGSIGDKNPEGKPFRRLTAGFVVKGNEETNALVSKIKAAFASVKAKAEALVDAAPDVTEESGEGGADIPI